MNLALVFGEKGKDIKNKLVSIKDNLCIDSYINVDDMISSSVNRGHYYDRVLIVSTILGYDKEDSLNKVLNYWRQNCQYTNVVLICNKGKDDDLAQTFTNMFSSSLCTAMLLSSTTMNTLSEACEGAVVDLNKKYGLSVNVDIEVEKNYIQNDVENEVKSEEPIQSKSKKKKGFLSSLFSKNSEKDKNEAISNNSFQVENELAEENYSNTDNVDWVNEYDKIIESIPVNNINTETSTFEENSVKEVDLSKEVDTIPTEEQVIASRVPTDFSNVINDSSSLIEENKLDSNFESVIQDDDNVEDYEDSNNTEYTPDIDKLSTNSFTSSDLDDNFLIENENEDKEEQFDNLVEEQEDEEEQFDNLVEEQEDEDNLSTDTAYIYNKTIEEVDIDLGDLTFNKSAKPVTSKTPSIELKEVNTELGDLGIGVLDSEYREQTEAPKVLERVVEKEVVKVVEKEVVKEVIKEVETSGVLSSLMKGKLSKVILVTGDRGSGVTTTALDIAMEFAKKTKVLYFDGDTELHGLLNYIDYNEFKKYDQQHMQGVKICKSSKAFCNCALRYDTNLDILTSDFGVEVSNDELIVTQSVVAEISNNYNVIVVDAPIDRLNCFQDLILQGNVVLCCEATKRGYMNMLCKIEDSPLPLRFKRSIAGKGTLALTMVNPKLNLDKLKKYISNIVILEDVDWMDMTTVVKPDQITYEFLSSIIEG